MVIIVDSGSTSADWRVVDRRGGEEDLISEFSTVGINPIFQSEEDILEIVSSIVISEPSLCDEQLTLYFYGAGVVDENLKNKLKLVFSKVFRNPTSYIESDIMGAAYALCGREPGIVCIMGTGSNSCLFDGKNIVDRTYAGGYILGDEGSGAYLGKRLISDFIKGMLPTEIEDEFAKRYSLDYPTIVQRVYKEEMPSRFLASFAPFLSEHKENTYVAELLKDSFREFVKRNIAKYDKKYSVNFIGSIAYAFREILEEVVRQEGFKMGKVIKAPIDGLTDFHSTTYY